MSIPMRTRTVMSASLALSILACASDPTSPDPFKGPSLARAAAETYTAVPLATLYGLDGAAFDINPAGQVVGGIGEWNAVLWKKGVVTDLGSFHLRHGNQ